MKNLGFGSRNKLKFRREGFASSAGSDVNNQGLGSRIKGLRKLRGTQEEFASSLDVDVKTVRRWEKGTSRPRKDTLSILNAWGLEQNRMDEVNSLLPLLSPGDRANLTSKLYWAGKRDEAERAHKWDKYRSQEPATVEE